MSWRVLAGANPLELSPIGTFARASFETKMWVPTRAAYFAGEAIGSSGQVLGASGPVAR